MNYTRERERHSLSFDYSVNNKQGETVPSGTSTPLQVHKKGCLVILLNLLSGHQRVDSANFSEKIRTILTCCTRRYLEAKFCGKVNAELLILHSLLDPTSKTYHPIPTNSEKYCVYFKLPLWMKNHRLKTLFFTFWSTLAFLIRLYAEMNTDSRLAK